MTKRNCMFMVVPQKIESAGEWVKRATHWIYRQLLRFHRCHGLCIAIIFCFDKSRREDDKRERERWRERETHCIWHLPISNTATFAFIFCAKLEGRARQRERERCVGFGGVYTAIESALVAPCCLLPFLIFFLPCLGGGVPGVPGPGAQQRAM